jgi:hypothetical protein
MEDLREEKLLRWNGRTPKWRSMTGTQTQQAFGLLWKGARYETGHNPNGE